MTHHLRISQVTMIRTSPIVGVFWSGNFSVRVFTKCDLAKLNLIFIILEVPPFF